MIMASPSDPVTAGLTDLPVVSEMCERAQRQLMLALGQHRRTEAALRPQVLIGGRLKVLPPGSMQAQHRREGMLVRCVTVVESFIAGQLTMRLAAQVPPPRSTLVEKLYADFEDKGTGSWSAMDDYFSQYVKKQLKIAHGDSPFKDVRHIIEARNALVHGLGRFTARQVRDKRIEQTRIGLRRLKFDLTSDELGVLVTPAALEESVRALRIYLEWVDGELKAHSPL